MTPWRSARPVEPVVTDDGVLVRGRVVPWEDVYHIAWTDSGGVVSTRAGAVMVGRAAAEEVERHIAPWEAQRDAAVYVAAAAFESFGLLVIRAALAQQGPPLVADGGGITAQGRRPRRYAWSNLRSVQVPNLPSASAGRPGAMVQSRQGSLNLLRGYERSGELIAAIQRCVAFRRETVSEPLSRGLFAGRTLFGGHGECHCWTSRHGLA